MKSQTLVSNDVTQARELARGGELEDFKKGDILIKQGDPDNDILFIVHGEVWILANDRGVAIKGNWYSLGEMALSEL